MALLMDVYVEPEGNIFYKVFVNLSHFASMAPTSIVSQFRAYLVLSKLPFGFNLRFLQDDKHNNGISIKDRYFPVKASCLKIV